MARESKADRQIREKAESEQAELERAAFRATMPLRFLKLQARAQARQDVETTVIEHAVGCFRLEVRFPCAPDQHRGERQLESLFLSSELWEVEAVERMFDALDEEDRERERKYKAAVEAYDRMSPEDRIALGVRKP